MIVINVHPTANRDGDWSPSGRHVPLQRAQLAAIADLAGGIPGPVVACGDYNVARDSGLFTEFLAATGMTDALGEACPPTFRPEYLEPGRRPQCIDFILTSASVKARHAQVILDGTPPLSDHLGLYAELRPTLRDLESSG